MGHGTVDWRGEGITYNALPRQRWHHKLAHALIEKVCLFSYVDYQGMGRMFGSQSTSEYQGEGWAKIQGINDPIGIEVEENSRP